MTSDKHKQNNLNAFIPGKSNHMLWYSINSQQKERFGFFSIQLFSFAVNKNNNAHVTHTSKMILRKSLQTIQAVQNTQPLLILMIKRTGGQ